MSIKYFDSHCHIHHADFDSDREAVLARMQELGMGAVVVGTGLEDSRKAVELSEQHNFLWAAVGLHPNDNHEEVFNEEAFFELAQHPKVVGIGECGLDYFRGADEKNKMIQKERFAKHLTLAEAVNKPLIIHCRPTAGTIDAHDDILEILRERSDKIGKPIQAIAHFFTSTLEIMQKYLALGCYISFPCVITFTHQYDEAVRTVPLDRLLVETDSPYAAPASHRGKRNEPSYVVEVVERIAILRDMSADEVARITLENSRTIFKKIIP